MIGNNELWGEESKSAENEYFSYMSKYPELMWSNFKDRSHFHVGENELGYEFKLSPRKLRTVFDWRPSKIFQSTN